MTGNNEHNLRRKYVPHLPSIQRVCALNYVRLIKLLPDCDTEDLEYQFEVNKTLNYSIKIVECSRYTSTVTMAQESVVIESQHIGALKPSYEYPNSKMFQKNEKEMVNLFLSEWLLFCSKHKNQLQMTSV